MAAIITQDALAIAEKLLKAETIGDVYALPFPLNIGPLDHPDYFASFYKGYGEDKMHIDVRKNGRKIDYKTDMPRSQMRAGFEPIMIVDDFCRVLAERLTPRLTAASWFARTFASARDSFSPPILWETKTTEFMSGRQRHGYAIHFDYPEALPRDMVALTVSSNESLAVPNPVAFDIIAKSSFAPFLDTKLMDPELGDKLETFYDAVIGSELTGPFWAAMVPSPLNTVNISSGLTIHTQPRHISPERVCNKTVIKFRHRDLRQQFG